MNQDSLNEKILSLIEKTKEDKIPWAMINAQTVRWMKGENHMQQTHTLTIVNQKHAARRLNRAYPATIGQDNFTLTFHTCRPNQVLLCVNTLIDPSLKYELANLFFEAQSSAKRKTAHLLEGLIQGI